MEDKKIKRIFIDTEFDGLRQNTDLISFGAVSDNGDTFYFESTDVDLSKVCNFVKENVLPCLLYKAQETESYKGMNITGCAPLKQIAKRFVQWLSTWRDYDRIELWADVKEYDVVLFNNMMETIQDAPGWKKPAQLHYIVHDLATLFWANGYDPDVNRKEFAREFSGIPETEAPFGPEHNALNDAMNTKYCFERIMAEKEERDNVLLVQSIIHTTSPAPELSEKEVVSMTLKEPVVVDNPYSAESTIKQAIDIIYQKGVGPLTDFDRKKLRMACNLLDVASDKFSNNGCNDTEERIFEEFTPEEKVELTKEYFEWNGDPENYDGQFKDVGDHSWMSFLSKEIEDISNK